MGRRAVAVSSQGEPHSPLCSPRPHWKHPLCANPLDTEGSTHPGGSNPGHRTGYWPFGELAAPCTMQPYTRQSGPCLGRVCREGQACSGCPMCRDAPPHVPGGWSGSAGSSSGEPQGSASPGRPALCVLATTPVWTQSPPPPIPGYAAGKHEPVAACEVMSSNSFHFLRADNFILFKKCVFFISLCLSFSVVLAEVRQNVEGGWEEVLIWTSCQAGLPHLPYISLWAAYPQIALPRRETPQVPSRVGGRWAESQREEGRRLSLIEEKKTLPPSSSPSPGKLEKGNGGGVECVQEKQKQCSPKPRKHDCGLL